MSGADKLVLMEQSLATLNTVSNDNPEYRKFVDPITNILTFIKEELKLVHDAREEQGHRRVQVDGLNAQAIQQNSTSTGALSAQVTALY